MAQPRASLVILAFAIGSIAARRFLLAREIAGSSTVKALFAEGESAVKAGKLTEAIAAFRKVIDADPDYVDAHQRNIEITQRHEDRQSRTPAMPRLPRQGDSGRPSIIKQLEGERYGRTKREIAIGAVAKSSAADTRHAAGCTVSGGIHTLLQKLFIEKIEHVIESQNRRTAGLQH